MKKIERDIVHSTSSLLEDILFLIREGNTKKLFSYDYRKRISNNIEVLKSIN